MLCPTPQTCHMRHCMLTLAHLPSLPFPYSLSPLGRLRPLCRLRPPTVPASPLAAPASAPAWPLLLAAPARMAAWHLSVSS